MSALNPTARDLARLLTQHESRVAALEAGQRTSQLQHASLTGTAITVYDEDGVTKRGAIGIQPDGTLGLVAVDGPAPGVPTAPVVTPSIGGLRVVWDGQLTEDAELPADFDHVAVHVSTSSGFTPSAATYVGTITKAGQGGMLPVTPLPYLQHYVVLVAVSTSAVSGDPSAETAATPVQVTGPDLTAGSVTAAAIQAGAVTADKLEAILSLVTRIVAGDPDGARVELASDGLRVYDSSGVLTIRFDSATGDAAFTGTITGSEISGSTITGGLIQTATTGNRITINESNFNAIKVYTGTDQVIELSAEFGLQVQGTSGAGMWIDPNASIPVMRFLTSAQTNSALIQSPEGAAGVASLAMYTGAFTGSGFTDMRHRLVMANDFTQLSRVRNSNPDYEVGGTVYLDGTVATLAYVDSGDSSLGGTISIGAGGITQSNITSGRMQVNFTAPNVVVTVQVTGMNLRGGTVRAVASPATQTPHQVFASAGTSSTDGFTIYALRTTGTQFINVDWIAHAVP